MEPSHKDAETAAAAAAVAAADPRGASSSSGVVVQVREKKGPLRAAIPYMPFPVAVICLFLNTFVPGLGKTRRPRLLRPGPRCGRVDREGMGRDPGIAPTGGKCAGPRSQRPMAGGSSAWSGRPREWRGAELPAPPSPSPTCERGCPAQKSQKLSWEYWSPRAAAGMAPSSPARLPSRRPEILPLLSTAHPLASPLF